MQRLCAGALPSWLGPPAPHSTAPPHTAPHRTAPHRTAMHCTTVHSGPHQPTPAAGGTPPPAPTHSALLPTVGFCWSPQTTQKIPHQGLAAPGPSQPTSIHHRRPPCITQVTIDNASRMHRRGMEPSVHPSLIRWRRAPQRCCHEGLLAHIQPDSPGNARACRGLVSAGHGNDHASCKDARDRSSHATGTPRDPFLLQGGFRERPGH